MKRCNCGSYAINIEKGELGDANCDVCHYKNKVTQVAAEAYQVIGALSSDLFHSKEVIRALDYFSAISCEENPSGEMLPFLCDWEQESPAVENSTAIALKAEHTCAGQQISITKQQSPRITEQDMRAIVSSAMHHYIFNDQNTDINEWMSAEGQALLKKLDVKDGRV